MRRHTMFSLLLPAALACSGSEPTAIKPEFATGCTVLPTFTAPAAASLLTDASSQSLFVLKNNCATTSSGPWDFTASRTGAVSSVGTPSPSFVTMAGGASAKITVPFNTGSTAGTGTVKLTATNDNLGPPPVSISATQTVTVSQRTGGIPFGLFGIRPDSVFSDTRWTGGVRTNKVLRDVLKQLAAAQNRSPKLRMWFNIVSGDETVFFRSTTDHSFNLQAWKDTLDNHLRGPGFKVDGSSIYNDSLLPYFNNGTLQGTILLDDLPNFNPDPTFAEIEAMAAHMKLRLPTPLTAVRGRAKFLRTQAGTNTYTKLDVAWGQYRSDQGTAAAFRNEEIAKADTLNLGLILGINVTRGMFPPGSTVPPDSLLSWGNALLQAGSSDYACGFMMWDITYDNVGHANMTTLSNLAKNHVASPCKRH
jgi:hypothetical protein